MYDYSDTFDSLSAEFYDSTLPMASSSPPSVSAKGSSTHAAACNENGGSPPSASDRIQASANRGYSHMSNNSILSLIQLFQILLLGFRCFPFRIDFSHHSTLLRILDPRWGAGIFSVLLIFWLWRLVDGANLTKIQADVVREWVERDTNLYLIRMIGCLAASTLTGDLVELLHIVVEGSTANTSFDGHGKVEVGGFVLFSILLLLGMIMSLVSLVWRLVWVPVLVVIDGLPQVEAQNFSKGCAEEARGRSSAVDRQSFGHSNHDTALGVHGSNRRVGGFSTYLKEKLYHGFGIVRKIGFEFSLDGSTHPHLIFQFLDNKRSGRLCDGPFHSPGDGAETHIDTEVRPRQSVDYDAPDAVSPDPNETEKNDWETAEDKAGKDEDLSAGPADSVERCDGNRCRWKPPYYEVRPEWTSQSDGLAAIRNLEDGFEAGKVEVQEDEEALDRFDQDSCALERGSRGPG